MRLGLGLILGLMFAGVSDASEPFSVQDTQRGTGALVQPLRTWWKAEGIPPNNAASDHVWLRRLYLAALGRQPTPQEQRRFERDKRPHKYRREISDVLDDPMFDEFWAMRWADMLKVKSEFPINLWPNATVVYHRRIQNFLENREPVDAFVRSLLVSQGSNFRDAEINFYRAMSERDSYHIAESAARAFLGIDLARLDPAQQQTMTVFFAGVRYKNTKEWKEEIVYHVPLSQAADFTFFDGRRCTVSAGGDPREAFTELMFNDPKHHFARTVAHWTWFHMMGRPLVSSLDYCNQLQENEKGEQVLNRLAAHFVESEYDFRALCRAVLNSPAFAASSVWAYDTDTAKAAACFAVYPVRRLDAEVLDDLICDILKISRNYQSVIPEPFTFLPAARRTVRIYDGSINSSFLLLFGRPARDNGLLSERNNAPTAKQRQYLFNSRSLNSRLWNALPSGGRLNFDQQVEALYRNYFARPPTPVELKSLKTIYNDKNNKKLQRRFFRELSWALLNSKEFLYQH